MIEQSEGNNHMSKINVFLLVDHEVCFFALQGGLIEYCATREKKLLCQNEV